MIAYRVTPKSPATKPSSTTTIFVIPDGNLQITIENNGVDSIRLEKIDETFSDRLQRFRKNCDIEELSEAPNELSEFVNFHARVPVILFAVLKQRIGV